MCRAARRTAVVYLQVVLHRAKTILGAEERGSATAAPKKNLARKNSSLLRRDPESHGLSHASSKQSVVPDEPMFGFGTLRDYDVRLGTLQCCFAPLNTGRQALNRLSAKLEAFPLCCLRLHRLHLVAIGLIALVGQSASETRQVTHSFPPTESAIGFIDDKLFHHVTVAYSRVLTTSDRAFEKSRLREHLTTEHTHCHVRRFANTTSCIAVCRRLLKEAV